MNYFSQVLILIFIVQLFSFHTRAIEDKDLIQNSEFQKYTPKQNAIIAACFKKNARKKLGIV